MERTGNQKLCMLSNFYPFFVIGFLLFFHKFLKPFHKNLSGIQSECPAGYKNFCMLNSVEQEIATAHKN